MENLEAYLAKAPAGKAFDAKASTFILDLPMPDGRLERFSVVNSPVMARVWRVDSLKSKCSQAKASILLKPR